MFKHYRSFKKILEINVMTWKDSHSILSEKEQVADQMISDPNCMKIK